MEQLEGLLQFSDNSLSIFDKLSELFLTTNLLFSFMLIVFVVFFCVRCVSNTKTATFLVLISFCVLIPFFPSFFKIFLEKLSYIFFDTFSGKIGIICCVVSVFRILLGLREEERTQEYVHGQYYWFTSIFLMYFGLFFISVVGITTKVLE